MKVVLKRSTLEKLKNNWRCPYESTTRWRYEPYKKISINQRLYKIFSFTKALQTTKSPPYKTL